MFSRRWTMFAELDSMFARVRRLQMWFGADAERVVALALNTQTEEEDRKKREKLFVVERSANGAKKARKCNWEYQKAIKNMSNGIECFHLKAQPRLGMLFEVYMCAREMLLTQLCMRHTFATLWLERTTVGMLLKHLPKCWNIPPNRFV